MAQVKVLIVDDSAFMRLLLQDMLANEPAIAIVGTASNGEEAWQVAKTHQPDVVLLDLTMPDFDGVYATKKIMEHTPCAILLLTAQNPAQSENIWEALDAGAIDFMLKPAGMLNSKIREQKEGLIQKILTLSQYNSHQKHPIKNMVGKEDAVVVIGASTGGTTVIEYLLSNLPINFHKPIIIAQHIPQNFAQSFAQRLQEALKIPILIPQEGTPIEHKKIYLLPTDGNMIVVRAEEQIHFHYTQEIFTAYNHPSIDALFSSVAKVYGQKTTAILLTGMGNDGVSGMEQIYQAGGCTIAQSQESCVVFGMPREAIMRGVVKEILAPQDMVKYLIQ